MYNVSIDTKSGKNHLDPFLGPYKAQNMLKLGACQLLGHFSQVWDQDDFWNKRKVLAELVG